MARHPRAAPGVGPDVTDRLRFVVLGDSIAAGTGAGRPGDALGPRLTAALAAEGIAADRFHPSSAGYARIAEALAPTVLAAARYAAGDGSAA